MTKERAGLRVVARNDKGKGWMRVVARNDKGKGWMRVVARNDKSVVIPDYAVIPDVIRDPVPRPYLP